jgi:hypothetical protein
MYDKKTFIDLCLEGKADLSDIDEYVEKWHNNNDDMPLCQFLGMTIVEYSRWVEQPEFLNFILFSRRFGISTEKHAEFEDYCLGKAMDAAKNSPLLTHEEALTFLEGHSIL